ncbi:MAG: portal protein [Gemmatimonadales bacterium]
MSDEDLRAFLDAEEKAAVGYAWGPLSDQREMNMRYYLGEPFGNELPERSQVVTSHVADSVEWILPDLIRVFAQTDKAVEFEAQSQEDAAGAKQATETVNYVFWRQNPGFLILYSWFKDALISKNGAVKWWWHKSISKKRETYQGLTLDELTLMIQRDPDHIEIVSSEESQGQLPDGQPTTLYTVEIEITEEGGKTCIAPIPPEELLVSKRHNSILLDDCPYVAHICKKTLSDLRDMGYEFEDEDVTGDGATWIDDAPEKLARDSKNEGEFSQPLNENPKDPSQREVWLREAYVLVDMDGDGIAERRRIVRAGDKIFENEVTDHVQIAALTPIIMTHRFFGMSVAELVMDLQLLGSTLWRSMIDNLFHSNNTGHIVESTADGRVQANIDDLMTSRPNRIIREYKQGAVRPEVVPYTAHQTFPMLEYIDQQRMNRTGANNLSSGLDADAINKTARGATLADNKMQAKIELIARIFAETGFKALFKGILHMLSKYSSKEMTYRLLNEYVTVDPRSWKTGYDMTVGVGIGTGNKDQQLMHLQSISLAQAEAVKAGGMGLIVTPKNIYNAQARICENAGFKNPAEFWTDPGDRMPEPPKPAPDPVKMRELDIKGKEVEIKRKEVDDKAKQAGIETTLKAGIAVHDGEHWDKDRQLQAGIALANSEGGDSEGNDGEGEAEEPEDPPSQENQLLAAIAQGQMQIAHGQQLMAQQLELLAQLAAAPRIKTANRGPDGRISTVTEQIQ